MIEKPSSRLQYSNSPRSLVPFLFPSTCFPKFLQQLISSRSITFSVLFAMLLKQLVWLRIATEACSLTLQLNKWPTSYTTTTHFGLLAICQIEPSWTISAAVLFASSSRKFSTNEWLLFGKCQRLYCKHLFQESYPILYKEHLQGMPTFWRDPLQGNQ